MSVGRDVRFALRLMRRTPVFSTVATVVLAIAVAVATAVFSLYSHLALQPVPGVQGADRLVSVGLARDQNEWIPFSIAQYRLLDASLTVPDALVAASQSRREVDVGGAAADAFVAGITRGFMRALGVPILLGVDLDAASADSAAMNAVVSERFWRERFDASPGAVGATVTIDDDEYTVVGVAGGGFAGVRRGAQPDDLWIPVEVALQSAGPRIGGMSDEQRRQFAQSMPFVRVYARLPAGTRIERLRQELGLVWPRLRAAPESAISHDLMRLEALPGTASNPRAYLTLVRQSQLLVGGAVLVLLVASLNLASFFLARGPARAAELRTRLAIGASRPAIVRQLFMEAAALIGIATALGLLLHFWLRTLLLRLPPFADMPADLVRVQTDWRVFAFIVGAAFVVTLVSGLLPAVRVATQSRLQVTAPTVLGRRSRNLQPLLVMQVAVATLVLLAGVLFVGELARLERAPTGFDAAGVTVGAFAFEQQGGRRGLRLRADLEQMRQFAEDLDARVTTLQGVDAFGLAGALPFFAPPANPGVLELVGVEHQPPEAQRRAYHNRVTPSFFRAFATRFLYGRPFEAGAPDEVVVSRTLAQQLWGRDDVVGERLAQAAGGAAVSGRGAVMMTIREQAGGVPIPRDEFTVVGVVDDIRYAGADDDYPPMLYRSWAGPIFGVSWFTRGSADPAVFHPVLDELVRERFPPLYAEAPAALTRVMRDALGSERARSRLAVAAALLALALTTIGLYASMQHMVEARRSELALRKAIGADDASITAMVVKRAAVIVGSGATLALALSALFRGRLSEVMFGLEVLSPVAWVAAIIIVVVTGIGASWWPARRAGRVDPAIALRYD